MLCKKAFDAQDLLENSPHRFGSNFWEESNLRAWLNSTAPAGEVIWPGNNPPTTEMIEYGEGYAEEKGFLHSDNFTEAERSLMKTVSQWTLLAENKVELATNGRSDIYKPHISHQAFESVVPSPAIQELGEKYPYRGAMYKVADTMFLLDGMQAYRLCENFGTANTDLGYWLRSPVTYTTDMARDLCDRYIPADVSESLGVRPAFYLNETRAVVAGGSGSEEDPYVLDSRKVGGIAVFHNGSEVLFDQEPVMEHDRVLVPVRAIFEATGAEVEWEEEPQTVTARTCMGTVIMQADNLVMTVDGEAIELDVPPRVVNGRTLVPVRAAAQGSGARVEWLEGLQRVVVTTGG